jgi:hypothetical protein
MGKEERKEGDGIPKVKEIIFFLSPTIFPTPTILSEPSAYDGRPGCAFVYPFDFPFMAQPSL